VFKTCWLTYLRHVVITVWVNTENRGLTGETTDKDFKIGFIRPIFQFLHKHLAVAFDFLLVDRIWQNYAFCMCRDIWTCMCRDTCIWTEFNTVQTKYIFFSLRAKSLKQKNTMFSHLSANFFLFEWKSTSWALNNIRN